MTIESMLPLMTGSGGALAVLLIWVWSLRNQNETLNAELKELGKEAVACIATVMARHDADKDWRARVVTMLEKITDHTRG